MIRNCPSWIVVCALFLTVLGCNNGNKNSANGNNSQPEIRIATLTWVGYGPFYLAQEKGFFEGVDVVLKKIDDTAARRAAVQSASVDASVDIVDSFTNAFAAGLPIKVVLKLDDSMGGDGIVAKNEIKSISDLKGKTVAYPERQPSHFFLLSMLDDAGIDIKDLHSKTMEPDQAGAAFISGSVDAAVTWEPWLTKASKMKNGSILVTSREKPGLIVDVLTVRKDYLSENPEAVKAVMKGWFKALDFIEQNPQESYKIMAKALELESSEFEEMVKGIKYSDFEDNQNFFSATDGSKSKFAKLVSQAIKIWMREGVIKKSFEPAQGDGSELVLSLQQ